MAEGLDNQLDGRTTVSGPSGEDSRFRIEVSQTIRDASGVCPAHTIGSAALNQLAGSGVED